MSERKQDKHASTAGQPRGLGSKNPKQGEEMIGAQAVVASLEAEGVDLVFGYPGGQAIKIYDALYDSKQLHHVLSRHEQGAVHEADGYARATGNVGVVIVTSGPGATNTVTGIATAYMDSVPLVVITGQVPRGVIGTDSFQESDIVGITMPVVKHSFLLQSTDELTSTFREAFHIAASGRPGPVLIDIPSDILSEKMVFNYPDKVNLPSYRPTYRGNAKQIRAAVQRIQRAERPVLYVGGGVISSGAADELVELANALQLPVVTTLMGKGAFPASNPLNIGPVGMHGSKYANLAMTESDLIIACGARFSDRVTGKLSEFAPHADVIHIDIDPAEIGKIRKVQIPIVGDLRGVLAGINEAVAKAGAKPITGPWLEQIAEWRRRFPFYHSDLVEDPGRIVPETVMQKLSRVTGMVSRRGFNIDSLSVGPTEDPTMSRITIIVKADELAYEQLTKQLNKLVSVFKITDLTDTSAIERELVLFKVNAAPDRRNEIIEIANVFRAKIVDVGRSSLTIEATGDESKLKGMEDLFRAYGIKEITRTGKIAMSRASKES